MGVWSLAWCWHIPILLTAGRGISAETCGLDDVFPPNDLCPRLCVDIFINTYANIYTSSVIGRMYTYTRSVVQYWWSCTPSQSIGLFWGSARFLCWMLLFVFFGLPIVSCSMINSLILGCVWPLVFVLNNILTLGIWRSAISHLPGSFCPWTFFQNIGFNMAPYDPFMSHLATQLG